MHAACRCAACLRTRDRVDDDIEGRAGVLLAEVLLGVVHDLVHVLPQLLHQATPSHCAQVLHCIQPGQAQSAFNHAAASALSCRAQGDI